MLYEVITSAADAKRIFNDEYKHSNIEGSNALTISSKITGREILLEVIKPNKKSLIEVNLKCY